MKIFNHNLELSLLINKIREVVLKRYSSVNDYKKLYEQYSALEEEVTQLKYRVFNYHRNRWDVLDCVADYLVNAELPGDYAEFGVFEGTTFGYCANLFGPLFPSMRFFAFDSFQGLPDPRGIDKSNNFTSGFYKGQFACSEEQFLKNVQQTASSLNPDRIFTIQGWFDQTLTPNTVQTLNLHKLACVWIDCDLYESTVPILQFIRPMLSIGTVILFDDWRCFRNLPDYGQQKACTEWLEADSLLALSPLISFGFHGQAFTVRSC